MLRRSDVFNELPYHLPGVSFEVRCLFRFMILKGFSSPIQARKGFTHCSSHGGSWVHAKGRDRIWNLSITRKGFQVIHLPIPDFRLPSKSRSWADLRKTVNMHNTGQILWIHCHAGLGKDSLFVAYLCKGGLGLSSMEAIHWTRK